MWLRLSALAVAAAGAGCSPGPAPGGASPAPAAASRASEWRVLFDGSSLTGWSEVGDANWSVNDATVMADSGNGYLVSDASYGDFDLDLEFWVSPDANSGVFIRCADRGKIGADSCYEVNIFDQRPDPTYRTGAIVNVAPPQVVVDTGGRWNHYEISAHGTHFLVKIDGEVTVDTDNDLHAVGPVALQYGAGTVKFRNIRLRTE
jgi:3-keto-disaccharide hydrolase